MGKKPTAYVLLQTLPATLPDRVLRFEGQDDRDLYLGLYGRNPTIIAVSANHPSVKAATRAIREGKAVVKKYEPADLPGVNVSELFSSAELSRVRATALEAARILSAAGMLEGETQIALAKGLCEGAVEKEAS